MIATVSMVEEVRRQLDLVMTDADILNDGFHIRFDRRAERVGPRVRNA